MTKDQVFTPLVKFSIVFADLVLIIAGMMSASELLVALFLDCVLPEPDGNPGVSGVRFE